MWTCSLHKISFLVATCFDVFLFLVPICNLIMDPPPMKWHLTQWFLTEVTRREGLGWEADLAAHVSTILFLAFISFCVICKANRTSLQSENFFTMGLSLNRLFSCLPQNLPSEITCLEALWELQAWKLNPHAWKGWYEFLTTLTLLWWLRYFLYYFVWPALP